MGDVKRRYQGSAKPSRRATWGRGLKVTSTEQPAGSLYLRTSSPCSSFREEVQPGPSPAPPAPPAGCLSPRTFGRIATYLRTPWSRSALALSLDYDTPALSRERGRKQDLPKKGRRKRAELHSNKFFFIIAPKVSLVNSKHPWGV